MKMGRLAFFVIKREEKIGLRLKDAESPTLLVTDRAFRDTVGLVILFEEQRPVARAPILARTIVSHDQPLLTVFGEPPKRCLDRIPSSNLSARPTGLEKWIPPRVVSAPGKKCWYSLKFGDRSQQQLNFDS